MKLTRIRFKSGKKCCSGTSDQSVAVRLALRHKVAGIFVRWEKFDEEKFKALPPGSFYTEPPSQAHFAETGDEDVVVQITGFGPSSTDYVDPKQDPRMRKTD